MTRIEGGLLMQARTPVLLLGFAAMAGAVQADGGPDIQPGLWEVVTQMKAPGMPAAMPPMTTRQCLTAEEISKRDRLLAHPPRSGRQRCETKDFVHKGNTVTWKMVCQAGQGRSQGAGEVVYESRTAYHGEIHIKTQLRGRTMDMTQHIKAHRTGECSR